LTAKRGYKAVVVWLGVSKVRYRLASHTGTPRIGPDQARQIKRK
jgi:hypothetical protein